jgi:hypothetical protein
VIVHPAAQNSLEWLCARAGVITASEMSNILTPTFKERDGEMRGTYMCCKLAERWMGSPLPGFSSIEMDFGKILEDELIPLYTFEYDQEVKRVGLCLTDDGKVGASPDGLIGEDGGLEAKCPLAQTHVKYLLAGTVPKEHIVQVHAEMYVTGRSWWNFVSYHRRMPLLLVRVERDEEIQEKIKNALASFLADFEIAYAKLIESNGGPPVRQAIRQPEAYVPGFDLIP